MKIPALEAAAKSHYDDRLPYHNFDHIKKALAAAEPILVRCRDAQIEVDEKVVYLAILFHDAGYHEDHKKKGFPHKEAYSAAIATIELKKAHYDIDFIHKVQQAILATHREANLTTIEEKIVRAADLAGMGSSYERFRTDAENLRQEHRILNGEELPVPEWKKMVESHIQFYLNQTIHITSSPSSSPSEFHSGTRENLEKFLREG